MALQPMPWLDLFPVGNKRTAAKERREILWQLETSQL